MRHEMIVRHGMTVRHEIIIIIIINRISRTSIYHTRWQHRALCNNTNHTHTHTHRVSDDGMGRAVKNSLEIIIKQVRLEGGFERVAECLRQTVPDRWASIRKRSFTKCFCVYTRGRGWGWVGDI